MKKYGYKSKDGLEIIRYALIFSIILLAFSFIYYMINYSIRKKQTQTYNQIEYYTITGKNGELIRIL